MSTEIEHRFEDAPKAPWWLSATGREQHFRAISDGIPEHLSVVTAGGEIVIANTQLLDYFGTTREELQGRSAVDTLHPEDAPVFIDALNRSMASGQPYRVKGRRRRADGAYRWFDTLGLPLRDLDGGIVYWFALERDFHDRKATEILVAGEKRLLAMVALGESLPVVLEALGRLVDEIASDCQCSILFVDPDVTTFRRGAAPCLPAGYCDTMDGRAIHAEAGPCARAAVLQTEVIVADIATDMRWEADGWQTLALAHGLRSCWSSPILSRARQTLGTFAIYRAEPGMPTAFQRDLIARLTHIASIAIERAHNEEALKRSEAFLAEAQHLSSTGSFSWHVATDRIIWSAQLYRIFEFDPGVTITLSLIASRVHPEDLSMMADMLNRARGDGSDFEYEHRLLMPDLSVKHLHLVGHGTRDVEGQVEYIAAVQDVTAQRTAEAALGRVRSELTHVARVTTLGALTASIAHEVNQPLAGIVTNASTCLRLLAAEPPNLDGARETARRTIRDGHRAADVVARLRALFSKETVSTEAVDLSEATQEVIALSLSELQRCRVIVQPELADDLPPVCGDRVQLQQVILNLLLNASDAMSGVDDRPRRLVIRTVRAEGDCVRVDVQDAGVGFESQVVDQLFDAFYTTKRSGMGIGLSVSRSIIESHQGRLWAAANDGPGATFSFSIPHAVEREHSTR